MEESTRDPMQPIEERLAELRPIEPRDPERFAAGRLAFLAQARQLKAERLINGKVLPQEAISNSDQGRHIGWIATVSNYLNNTLFRKKEQPAMLSPIITALVVITLLFGGAGATAYAAQDSLPVDALYPVKTLTEDVQFDLSAQEQSRLELALTFAERRVGEMAAMAALGVPVPANVATRMGEKVESALQIAAGLEGQSMQEALGLILTRMQQQEQILAGLEAQPTGDKVLAQVRLKLQEQLRLAAQGLSDPDGLKQQLQERARIRAWMVLPVGASGNDNTNDANGNGNGNSNTNDANGNDDNGNGNTNDANGNGNTNDANSNDDNGNGGGGNDNANSNDGNGNGDDDDNGNDDNGNGNTNDDDGNENDDDNGNGNDANSNDDDGDDDNGNDNANSNDGGDDDVNGNGNGGSGDDDDDNGNDGSGSGGGGDDDNGNDNGGSGGGGGNDDYDDNSGSGGGGGNDDDDNSGSGGGGNDDDGGSGGGGNDDD